MDIYDCGLWSKYLLMYCFVYIRIQCTQVISKTSPSKQIVLVYDSILPSVIQIAFVWLALPWLYNLKTCRQRNDAVFLCCLGFSRAVVDRCSRPASIVTCISPSIHIELVLELEFTEVKDLLIATSSLTLVNIWWDMARCSSAMQLKWKIR